MLVPVVFQAVPLLLCDRILLSLLNGWSPSLVPLGVSAAWLEAALRLLVLFGVRGLLSMGRTSPVSFSTVAAVSIMPPLYLLMGHWLGDPPLLVSSAAWSWWLAIYGAVGFSQLLWGILAEGRSPKESRKEDKATLWKMLHLFRPDKLYLTGAFLFLVLAVIGETFLPYYIGRLIDILGTKYDAEAFSTAISLLFLISFVRKAFLPKLLGLCSTPIQTGQWVLIKAWREEKLTPTWEGLYIVLLTTKTAIRTAEKGWTITPE